MTNPELINENIPGVEIDDTGEYIRITDPEVFEKWIKDGDWNDEKGFIESTGFTIQDLLNEWFTVVHNQVYLKDDENIFMMDYENN
jgi:hypothetical protein